MIPRGVIMPEEKTSELGEVARIATASKFAILLDRKDEINVLEFSTIEKMKSLLEAEAASNGVCGVGCASEKIAKTGISK